MKMQKIQNKFSLKHGLGRDIAMAAVGLIGANVAKNLYNRFVVNR